MRTKPVIALTRLLFHPRGRSKSTPRQKETLNLSIARIPSAIKPIRLLHKTFPVKEYVQLEFEVPPIPSFPDCTAPSGRLCGGPEMATSATTAPSGFLLMESEQFSDFSHATVTELPYYTVDPTHDHEVEFPAPAHPGRAQEILRSFRNSPGGARSNTWTQTSA